MSPLFAISLKHKRDNLNFLRHPLALPVIWQRLRKRTGEEFLGNLLREAIALRRSSSLNLRSRIIFLSCCRFSHFSFTSLSLLFCLAMEELFAIKPTLSDYFLRAGPFCLCLRFGSNLLITYTRPLRRTILSPLEGSALIDALTFMVNPVKFKS